MSDEDRQRVVDELERRAAQGQLTAEELADRAGRARSVLTHAGLDGILLDLPTPRTPGSHRPWALPGAPTPGTAAPATRPAVHLPPAAPPAAPPGGFPPGGFPPAPRPGVPLGTQPGFPPAPAFPPATGPAPRRATVGIVVALTGLVLLGAVVATLLATPDQSDPSGPSASPARPAPSDAPDEGQTVVLAVGPDIRPGVYIAEPEDGVCHYERTELLPGGDPDLVVAERSSARLIIEVVPSDYRIRLRNCGPLVPYVAPATAATSLGDGDWLVGSDVVAGRYRVIAPDPDSRGCRWSRAPGAGYAPSETVRLGRVTADDPRPVVDVVDGERFSSSGCGLWARE